MVSETEVTAAETGFRGAGFAVATEIDPGRSIFGADLDRRVLLHGETPLPPERRTDPGGPRFPPDSLREVPFWDQARPHLAIPVLCLTAEPPVVRALVGPEDDLPAAVALIHGWLDSEAGHADVERDLTERRVSPVAWVAGFELLLRTSTDVADLSARFLRLPNRPGAAARGVLTLLRRTLPEMPESEIAVLAQQLLDAMVDETDPEALVAYLSLLDAEHQRITAADAALADAVRTAAERAVTLHVEGPDGEAWAGELARFAGPLRDRG